MNVYMHPHFYIAPEMPCTSLDPRQLLAPTTDSFHGFVDPGRLETSPLPYQEPPSPVLHKRTLQSSLQRWSVAEERLLFQLVQQHQGLGESVCWDSLVVYFPGRTTRSLETKFNKEIRKRLQTKTLVSEAMQNMESESGDSESDELTDEPFEPLNLKSSEYPVRNSGVAYWSKEDDTLLRKLCGGDSGSKHKKWSDIALNFPGRSWRSVESRWNKHLKPKDAITRSKKCKTHHGTPLPARCKRWNGSEDNLLRDAVRQYVKEDGTTVWEDVALAIPGRSSLGVRSRWNWLMREQKAASAEVEKAAHVLTLTKNGTLSC
ncbi:hypothetical protein T439DRAFT_352094 [Meredithblackwellia eburnea MCA 4105]